MFSKRESKSFFYWCNSYYRFDKWDQPLPSARNQTYPATKKNLCSIPTLMIQIWGR